MTTRPDETMPSDQPVELSGQSQDAGDEGLGMSAAESTEPVKQAAPPRISGYPVVGVLPQILWKHLGALNDWFERGGDIFDITLMGVPLTIVARGELAAEAVINQRACYVRSPAFSDGLRLVAGDSILTRDGAPWRERRHVLQPTFHARAVHAMVGRIQTAFDKVLDEVEPGRVEISSLCDRLTMNAGLRVMFGHSLAEETFEELRMLGPQVISRVALGWLTTKLPKWVRLPGEARFRKALARLDEILFEMVQARRCSGDFGDDFLGTLLHLASKGELDDRGIRDEAVTMLLAGYETTSNSLSWTIHTLAGYPEVAAKIRAEANEVLVNGDGDVRKLAYSLRAFKEGLRLHPAALWFPRLAVQDNHVGGYSIAAGQTIACSIYLIHQNPKDWPEPSTFDPDRFAVDTPRYAWMPFGIGQQMCIGKHLALLEGQVALAKLCSRWEVLPVADHVARMRISTTLSNADGIYVELRPVSQIR
jgi:cytochrome P450